jgi:formate/nitrite transporter FocA (FNT family)
MESMEGIVHRATAMPELETSPELDLTQHEKRRVLEGMRSRAAVLHEAIRLEGEHEITRPASALAWSGLAAGLSMGFSLVAMGLARASLPDRPWRPLVVNLGYCVGFVIVIVARQQLFTENTLTAFLPLLHTRTWLTLRRLLRLWGVVLATNLAGTLVIAIVLERSSAFSPPVKAAFADIGAEALHGGFGIHLLRGIFAGWLIALMVWMLPEAHARAFLVVLVTYLVGLGGLSHVIAGSVETLYAVIAGRGTWGEYLGDFLVPVLIGNTLGGSALVAALGHAQVAAEAR